MYLIASAIFWFAFCYTADQPGSQKVTLIDVAPMFLSFAMFVVTLLLYHFS